MQTVRTAWRESLACEYLRLLLIGSGACYALYWAVHWLKQLHWQYSSNFAGQAEQFTGGSQLSTLGFAMVGLFVSGSAVLTSRMTNRAISLTTTAVAVAFLLVLILREYTRTASFEYLAPFSPAASIVYVAGLVLLTLMQLDQPGEDSPKQVQSASASSPPTDAIAVATEAIPQLPRNRSAAKLAKGLVGGSLLLLLLYMVVWPATQWAFGWGEFDVPTTMGDQLTLGQEIRVRSAKLAVFLIFVAFGASFGSFLHVVAYTLPRGQGVPLRSSACPVCNSRIRLIDNIPIVSYLRLRGRCRDCGTEIPIRYLWAELLMATLFAGFFLLELVTGAKNLPGFREVFYTGIVWVILYTKWDIVGIVGYHLFIYMALLTTLYANWQHRRMPWYFWGAMFLGAGCLPLFFPFLLPMKLGSPGNISGPLLNGMTSLAGGFAGAIFGSVLQHCFSHRLVERAGTAETNAQLFERSAGEVLPAMILLGLGLGWQAVSGTTAILCLLLLFFYCFSPGRPWLKTNGLLPMLLVAGILHQFAWKWLVKYGQPVWLHQNSSWVLASAFAVVTIALLFLISRGWKSHFLKVNYDG